MMHAEADMQQWPALPYDGWRDTCSALHLWSQIVGKYRLAHTPWINHSWHATLYVTPRGLTTGPVADGGRVVTLDFDFCDHRLVVQSDGGASESFALQSMSVADFLARAKRSIAAVGGSPEIHAFPNEVPDAVAFADDTQVRPYDAAAIERFHGALLRIDRTFGRFRTSFVGKVSPVHLFWGAFDMAVTRFSGRRAPLHPGGVPNLPDAVAREAYSHEVSSAGFWPGGGGVDEAMFYSYAYPEPEGFRDAPVQPDAARFDERLGEFLLPYSAVRSSDDPEPTLLAFLKSTYEAAAECGHWDRAALECELGRPRSPRLVVPSTGEDSLRRRSAEEVLDDHLQLAGEHRFDEDIQRNVSPDCVILERRGIFHGREGARHLARLLEEELPDAPYTYINRLVAERIAFLQWTAEAQHTRVRDGADSFVIEDGWIVAQTIHYTVETVEPR